MPSALHHALAFFPTLISAAVLRHSTALLALGAATSAGAREGEARRREAGATALRAHSSSHRSVPLRSGSDSDSGHLAQQSRALAAGRARAAAAAVVRAVLPRRSFLVRRAAG